MVRGRFRRAGLALAIFLGGCGPVPESDGAAREASGAVSAIRHLVVVIQENHTFDAYFGTYCTATPGSSPACTSGPACCEAGPSKVPGANKAVTLDDDENLAYSPPHGKSCELGEMNGGAMNRYVTGSCGDRLNFAYADANTMSNYWGLASQYAVADRYFQPVAGASSANDMYFAQARWAFDDNQYEPDAIGASCQGATSLLTIDDSTKTTNIGDLLADAGVAWAFYAEGYSAMVAAQARGTCPPIPPDCPPQVDGYPCTYDPGDDPFVYYERFRDNPVHIRDLSNLSASFQAGTLPAVSFVKAIGYKTEHPGDGTITVGEGFVSGIVDEVLASPTYARDTLVLVTWDESGGYFDHVAPPPDSPVDGQPYGPRIPLLAIGAFVRHNDVSHVVMEHSSIVKFIEWNWLHGRTGQLGARDAVVNNIGSLLDPTRTEVPVPEGP